ncbi:RNI-like protein [Cucurbitaria berberidis CBS 394.84]|uniref:RNI-like protein n=1 Tax=Cucurbitaria berberidis CBS 394.84 TaxID=1168544 RepID=A0A9P4GPN5_9PLEO|nr:RNI-like protein [Cucurbitaria berberidis CBS 394.84]KAF1849420.1 RNI-like protein [Cucurbitaria berberidis CBS 394.84]
MTAVQAPPDTAAAMEEIHGVDVSWLHHSTRDHHHRQQAPTSPGLTRDAPPKTSSHGGLPTRPRDVAQHDTESAPAVQELASPPPPSSPTASSATTTPQKILGKRPALLGRGSTDKYANGNTPPDARTTSRRNSWMSSLSSKFASQNSPAQTTLAQAQGSPATANSPTHTTSSANGALNGIQAASGSPNGGFEPYVPQQPKGSFISNALRRLSSGTQVGTSPKVSPNGGMCPRKVMNVDHHRSRCLVPELDASKLRKVAFCVDVEIAGGPKYKDDLDTDEKKKNKKEKKLKERGEGEALKHPDVVAEEKDKAGVVAVSQEVVGNDNHPEPQGPAPDEDNKEPSRKKEKKKRSEAERKERKEKKRKKAEEDGSIPLEFTREDDEGSVEGAPVTTGTTALKAQDRPTIDPLRIYRRCCQLRESPILKRISDQLSAPRACATVQPRVVTSLDLTGSRLQLADVVTLSDWLAIVPVKKLFLEDADLNDEKIRVILAGLLAAKVPEAPRRRALGTSSNGDSVNGDAQQGSCAIKKLVLKNNPKITSEGWKHIALFIYLCRSIMALDVSMIPFPQPRPPMSPTLTNDAAHRGMPTKETRSRDFAEILSKAMSERLGGSELQELVMAECNLTSSSIRRIIDGCIISGIQRLGLATNDIDSEGLQHVLHYIRSGVCQGIDLGGNDLRAWISTLCESLSQSKNSALWALCLQDTGLTPESLKILFPALISLPSFRFLDLSHNSDLFVQPMSLCLLRKYMPQFKELKRLHLMDVDMKPEDAIAIAEILPDCPHIAHISFLENPEISRVVTSTDEETQEEAAALYASLTLAAKLSHSLICVDVDVPAPEMDEVVKALAKQVVAYCLRNIESINEVPELHLAPKEVELPHILKHLVGRDDSYYKDDSAPPAPDTDYIVSGTGIAKALSYCLSHKATDLRRVSQPASGTSTPRSRAQDPEEPSKARAMSKDLLETARNTRSRIQPALAREAKSGNDTGYRRLLFLDQTLQGMIQRFEDEYPETRLQPSDTASIHSNSSVPSSSAPASTVPTLDNSITDITSPESDEDEPLTLRSRHNSDVSLASRHMSQEEGRLHRFGHRVRTGLLNPSRPSSSHEDSHQAFMSGTMDDHGLPEHIMSLRDYFSNYSGDEIRHMIERAGWEKAFDSVVDNAEELKSLEKDDPAAFKIFRESQIAALKNRNPDIFGPGELDSRKSGDDFAIED